MAKDISYEQAREAKNLLIRFLEEELPYAVTTEEMKADNANYLVLCALKQDYFLN
jgi:hypothetical protein